MWTPLYQSTEASAMMSLKTLSRDGDTVILYLLWGNVMCLIWSPMSQQKYSHTHMLQCGSMGIVHQEFEQTYFKYVKRNTQGMLLITEIKPAFFHWLENPAFVLYLVQDTLPPRYGNRCPHILLFSHAWWKTVILWGRKSLPVAQILIGLNNKNPESNVGVNDEDQRNGEASH